MFLYLISFLFILCCNNKDKALLLPYNLLLRNTRARKVTVGLLKPNGPPWIRPYPVLWSKAFPQAQSATMISQTIAKKHAHMSDLNGLTRHGMQQTLSASTIPSGRIILASHPTLPATILLWAVTLADIQVIPLMRLLPNKLPLPSSGLRAETYAWWSRALATI